MFDHAGSHPYDTLDRIVEIARQFACGNADHRYAARDEPSIAPPISLGVILGIVDAPIDLNSEPRL